MCDGDETRPCWLTAMRVIAPVRPPPIAKGDRDPELRKKAIFWLGQKNDPRIRQLLLDIINNG